MKKLLLTVAAMAAVAVGFAANDGSTEAKAKSLTPSSSLKSASVSLFPQIVKEKDGTITTNFVCYFKMKLKKKTAYTVYIDDKKGPDGLSDSAAGIHLTEDSLYPKLGFNAPIAEFERTVVGDSDRFVMTGKKWGTDWEDEGWSGASAYTTSDSSGEGLGDDFGDWDWTTPSTWDYYVRVTGNEGEKATLWYGIGKHIPTGIEQNPLVLKPTTTPQVTKDPNKARQGAVAGDMQFWSSNYFCQVAMKLGCRYHFTSSKGSESNALTVAYLGIDGTVRANQEEVSKWDFAETFVPRKSGTYLLAITSTASNYVNATGKMEYWMEPEKPLAKHAFRTLTADVPIDDCRPGNINARLFDETTGDNTNKYFDAIIDEELFSFTAAKGKNYVIETTGAETNLLMRIYDAKGAVLMENTGNGSNFNVRCAISAPSKKTTYYVGVAQNFGYDDDIGTPTRAPVTVVQRTIASTNLGDLRVDPVPTADGDDPAVRDEGIVIPQLGAENWYDMYTFKARKNVTYAFCTTWADENEPTNGYALVADVYMLKSGKKKAVSTGLDITPTSTNALSNVIAFKASSTTTYYVRLRVKEGDALDYPQVRLHAIGYSTDGADPLGRLTVIPEGAAAAKWTIDKESTKYSVGDSILLPAGVAHTVKFTSVSGYTKPGNVSAVTIPETNTVVVTGVDARYVDSVEPKDNKTSGATKWTLKQNKTTSYARTLWYNGKGGATDTDPADYYLITPKDGRYYDISFAANGCNAAFDIYRADGTYLASNATDVAKLQLPTSASKYYVIVHRNHDVDVSEEGAGTYKITGQYADVGVVSFAKTAVSVKDNANTVTLTVKRGGKDGKLAVRYYTVDGTATAGEHYVAQTNVLLWAAKNKSNKTITVKLIPKLGAWYDGDSKTFSVVLEPLPADGVDSDYVAQVKTPVCTVTRTETGLDKKKNPITQESVYAKAAAKVATVKKSENAPLETGVFYGVGQNTTNDTYGQTLTNGLPEFAAVTLTSAISKGKTNLTAKVSVGGKSYTFKGVGWDACDGDIAESRMTLMTTVNKKAYTNVLDVYVSPGCTTNEEAWLVRDCGFSLVLNVPDANGKGVQTNMLYRGDLCRRNAGIQDYLNVVTNFAGYYTATLLPDGFARTDRSVLTPEAAEMAGLPLGNGYLTLTVDNKGTVKVAGKLADGTSVSTSVTAAPIARDSGSPLGWKMFVPLYSAKSPYVLFGLLRIVAQEAQEPRPDGRAWDLVVRGRLFWNNDSGTVTYDGTQGYRVGLTSVGGWYDKIVNLQSYYRDYAYQVETAGEFPKETLPSGYEFVAVGPCGEEVELSGNGMAAPTRRLTKAGKTYDWETAVNPCNVKIKFARATGIVSGTLSLWSEKPGTKPAAKEITGFKHYGILTMDRDTDNPLDGLYTPDAEVFTAGFLQKDVKIPVTTKKSRTWKYSAPFDIVLPTK